MEKLEYLKGIHILLNWRWIKAVTLKLFEKTTGLGLRTSWIINLLLFVCMTGIIVTGLMISKTLPFHIGGGFGAQQWHYFFAAISIVLMGLHLGLHWSFLKGIASKASFVPKKLASAIGILVLVAALGWGGYSLYSGSFVRWISGPFIMSSFTKEGNADNLNGENPNWGIIGDIEDFDFSEGEIPPDNELESGEKPSEKGFESDEMPPDNEFEKGETPDTGKERGKGNGMGRGPRDGKGNGMGEGPNMDQDISIVRMLNVIATYGSEMIVFAFITVLIMGGRKKSLKTKNENE